MPPSPDYLLLSTFTYDVDAPNYIQTFPVPRAITDMGIKMGVVIWKFKSNWGAEDYTCLYRVSLYPYYGDLGCGLPPISVSHMKTEWYEPCRMKQIADAQVRVHEALSEA